MGILEERLKKTHEQQEPVTDSEVPNKQATDSNNGNYVQGESYNKCNNRSVGESYSISRKCSGFSRKEFQTDSSGQGSRVNNSVTEEDLPYIDELEELMSEQEIQKGEKRQNRKYKILQFLLAAGCIYFVFLIYGTLVTDYTYDQTGKIIPVVLTVNDIEERNEFNKLYAIYLQSRGLYEKILILDYRVASGVEDTLNIAPEYEKTLDEISKLAVQVDAASISSEYNQVRNMMLTWVKTHIAAYCQYMSTAITQNDETAAQEAIACREVVNSNFRQITENIITIGSEINGIELADIKNWSPESYIASEIEGIE